MTIPTITPLPTAPARTDPPATFVTRADSFLAALVTMQTELNTSIGAMNTDIAGIAANVTAAQAAQTGAETAETNAEAAQAAAEAASSATLWVSGTSYSAGDVVYSPITFFSYRANTSFTSTTDPSLDSVNWVALTASDGGATVEVVATGTISGAGVTVALRSDGTVETISYTGNPEVIGTQQTKTVSAIQGEPLSVYNPEENYVISIYNKGNWNGTQYSIMCSVATISNGVLTYGSEYDLTSQNSNFGIGGYGYLYNAILVPSSNDANDYKVVICHQDSNNYTRVGSIEVTDVGGTLTPAAQGSTPVEYSLTTAPVRIVAMPELQKFAIVYCASASTNQATINQIEVNNAGNFLVRTVSTIRSAYFQNNYRFDYLSWDGTAVTVVYGNNSEGAVKTRRCTPSGTGWSLGSETTIATSYSNRNAIAYDPDNSRWFISYNPGGSQAYGKVGYLSGSNVITTLSSEYAFPDSGDLTGIKIKHDSTTGDMLCFYHLAGSGKKLQKATISDKVISFGTPSILSSGAPTTFTVADTGTQYFVTYYINGTTFGSVNYVPSTIVTNADQFIGFAQDSAVDAGEVNIATDYMIDANQTGLTPKSIYYVDYDGSLTTSETVYPIAGYAINSTTIQVAKS